MTVHYFFRDTLAIDDSLLDRLDTLGITPAGGDTLVLGAANCQLTSMSGAFDYVILAGMLTTGTCCCTYDLRATCELFLVASLHPAGSLLGSDDALAPRVVVGCARAASRRCRFRRMPEFGSCGEGRVR